MYVPQSIRNSSTTAVSPGLPLLQMKMTFFVYKCCHKRGGKKAVGKLRLFFLFSILRDEMSASNNLRENILCIYVHCVHIFGTNMCALNWGSIMSIVLYWSRKFWDLLVECSLDCCLLKASMFKNL